MLAIMAGDEYADETTIGKGLPHTNYNSSRSSDEGIIWGDLAFRDWYWYLKEAFQHSFISPFELYEILIMTSHQQEWIGKMG